MDQRLAALSKRSGELAAELDIPTAAYLLGVIYTTMLPHEVRSRFGMYYTPPILAARLIALASAAGVDWRASRIVDPACGGGAFLAPIVAKIIEVMRDDPPSDIVREIAERLEGFEIDPLSAWTAQVFAEMTLMPVCRAAGSRLPNIVTVRDSLDGPLPRQAFDLVIANPPYGRISLRPDRRRRFQRSLYGHANLYGLFTDIALDLVREGGVIAYVTPASFLAGQYFKRLRGILGREAPPAAIDFVATRKGVFDDVLQEAVLTIYKRAATAGRASVHLIDVDERGLKVRRSGTFAIPADPEEPWLIPRSIAQEDLVAALNKLRFRLADYGYAVSTGPLVWNRHKAQLAKGREEGALPLIWAESVQSDGRFQFRAERRNHAPYFKPRPGDDWLVTREPCILLQRTTAREQARRLIAAELPADFLRKHGAVVVENHLNMIRPIARQSALPLDVLAAFLNTTTVDQAFRCVNGSVAISAFELESLPLPDPSSLDRFSQLVRAGRSRDELDRECARAFGIGVHS